MVADFHLKKGNSENRFNRQPWVAISPLKSLLLPLLDVPGDKLSGGEETLVGFVCAVLACRRYLFLDEPSAGASAELSSVLARAVSNLVNSGEVGVMLAEQDPDFAARAANGALLIREADHSDGASALPICRGLFEQYTALRPRPRDLVSWLGDRVTTVAAEEGAN